MLEAWRWNGARSPTTTPQRCRADQGYLIRVQLSSNAEFKPEHGSGAATALRVRFWSEERLLQQTTVELGQTGAGRAGVGPRAGEWLGWVCSPPRARRVQIELAAEESAAIARVEMHAVAEHDGKCHPLANVPHWRVYQRKRAFERVLVPEALAPLARHVPELNVAPVATWNSLEELHALATDSILALDRPACEALRMDYAAAVRLAGAGCLIVDLPAMVYLVARKGLRAVRTHLVQDPHGLMSARNLFAHTATRGFALLDTFPYGALRDDGGFVLRAIRRNRAWNALAAELGFHSLLESQTPWSDDSGDVVCAIQTVEAGELITSDVPFLAAAADDRLLAPRLTRHLLRMLLGLPLDDAMQYWTRWDEPSISLRDIAELPRRYEPLRAERWAAGAQGLPQLAITLAPRGVADEHVVIATGRIDTTERHDGLPPEPMMIFMKWLAREAREGTAWFAEHVGSRAVTWLFESAAGTQYVSQYPAANELQRKRPTRLVRVRAGGGGAAAPDDISIELPRGVFGDGAFEFQSELTKRLCGAIRGSAGVGR